MALPLPLRRALSLSSSTICSTATAFLKPHSHFAARPTPTLSPFASPEARPLCPCPRGLGQCLSFRSSPSWFDRRGDSGEGKIGPDEILFEGCDYNHWLITMDFPKDPKPTPEQMVETYVQTLAKVVGSREEAMKRMYACSTTTYHGFQAVMTEEMSEKFRGLPGVVFILPDSYIDPINKEYGGDKYEMGKITPRPPPVQYGRQGRYNDRNRNYDRPRYGRPRDSMSTQQGNAPYDRQGPMQYDNRSYTPHQQYGSTGQQGPQSYGSQSSIQGPGPNYNPPQNQYPTSQQGESSYYHRGSMQDDANANQQGYGQPSHFSGRRDNAPGGSGNHQAERSPTPAYNMNVSQGEQGNFGTQEHGRFPQGQHEGFSNSYPGMDYRQGRTPGSGQNAGPGEAQSFPPMENKSQGRY